MSEFEEFMITPKRENEIRVHLPEFAQDFIFQELPLEDVLQIQKSVMQDGKIDTTEYITKLAIYSMVYPNLKNTSLQQWFKVVGERSLFFKLVGTMSNYYLILNAMSTLYNLKENINEDIQTAKN